MSKRCFVCGVTKVLESFYRHPQMSDGHLNKCKLCTRRDVRENRTAKFEHYSAYERSRAARPDRVEARRRYARTAAGKAAHTRACKWQRVVNADKYKARTAVGNALRAGKLKRLPCQVCGTAPSQAHHRDYSKPLEVLWLCRSHHAEAHRA